MPTVSWSVICWSRCARIARRRGGSGGSSLMCSSLGLVCSPATGSAPAAGAGGASAVWGLWPPGVEVAGPDDERLHAAREAVSGRYFAVLRGGVLDGAVTIEARLAEALSGWEVQRHVQVLAAEVAATAVLVAAGRLAAQVGEPAVDLFLAAVLFADCVDRVPGLDLLAVAGDGVVRVAHRALLGWWQVGKRGRGGRSACFPFPEPPRGCLPGLPDWPFAQVMYREAGWGGGEGELPQSSVPPSSARASSARAGG